MSFARDAGGDSGGNGVLTCRCNFSGASVQREAAASWGRAPCKQGRTKGGTAVALARVAYWMRVPRMSNAVLGLRIKQQLTLTPRLQQSVKLLQLSALECVQELHQAITQNPFLEETADIDSRSQSAEEGADSSESSEAADLDFAASGVGGGGGGEETPDWTEWTASPSTLHDSLREQLLLLGLTERDHVLANLIIDALDDDGFLRLPLEDVAAL